MRVESIELFLLDLPLTEPFVASHGKTLVRTITVARLDTDIGPGWGECAALPAATYTGESAVGSFDLLAEELGPPLIGRSVAVGDAAVEFGVAAPGDGPATSPHPMAGACLEMAALDAWLTARGQPLADWLGADRSSVTAGVSIGLDSVAATVRTAASMVADGYRRLKVKIQPGHDRDLVQSIRQTLPEVELQVDANGAYPADALDLVADLADLGVDAFEQPFGPDDVATTAALISRLEGRSIPVVADEAVQSVADAQRLIAAEAMTGLSIKPSRVGGYGAARTLHDLCIANNIPATAGGMLETGLGRHGLVAAAALPGFSLTGDISPAGRWLAADPWPDIAMTDGRIEVPTGPGVAPSPDRECLDRHTVAHRVLDKPTGG